MASGAAADAVDSREARGADGGAVHCAGVGVARRTGKEATSAGCLAEALEVSSGNGASDNGAPAAGVPVAGVPAAR